jgi:hypothetical protein
MGGMLRQLNLYQLGAHGYPGDCLATLQLPAIDTAEGCTLSGWLFRPLFHKGRARWRWRALAVEVGAVGRVQHTGSTHCRERAILGPVVLVAMGCRPL